METGLWNGEPMGRKDRGAVLTVAGMYQDVWNGASVLRASVTLAKLQRFAVYGYPTNCRTHALAMDMVYMHTSMKAARHAFQ